MFLMPKLLIKIKAFVRFDESYKTKMHSIMGIFALHPIFVEFFWLLVISARIGFKERRLNMQHYIPSHSTF